MSTKKFSVKLIKVSNSDLRFLYNLLKERDSRVNISHRMMPTFNEHVKFVLSRPYFITYQLEYGLDNTNLTCSLKVGIIL